MENADGNIAEFKKIEINGKIVAFYKIANNQLFFSVVHQFFKDSPVKTEAAIIAMAEFIEGSEFTNAKILM